MENHEQIIDDLSSRDNDELLFMASMIRLILDEREVYYPSRESEMEKPTMNMFMAKLDKASFESLVMPRTNFRQAYLYDSVITGSDLEASDFSFSKIGCSNLVNCSLVEANFEAAVLRNVRLDGVDFTGANLKNCEWIDCSADKVIFTDAITEGFIINGKPFDTDADLEKKEKDIKVNFLFFLKNTIMQNEYGRPLCLDKPNSQINNDFKEVLFRLEKCGIQIKQSKSLFADNYTHFEFNWSDL